MNSAWNSGKWIATGILYLVMVFACAQKSDNQTRTPDVTVDPYALTKGNDHVFLGADIPSGIIQIGPQTSGGAGYNYNDSIITGFILSYTEEGKKAFKTTREDLIRFFPSTKHEQKAKFRHNYEVAKPGYYSIYMHETDIAVELTATKHTVFQRYFFPPKDSVQVSIDKELTIINDSTVAGQTPNTSFMVLFSRPMRGITKNKTNTVLFFDATEEEMLYIKVGTSTQSIEDAKAKLEEELPDWNFEAVKP